MVMFAVILFVFYLSFATSGFLIFSGDVLEYRDYLNAITSMNRFMLNGMEYDDLTQSAGIFGSIYFFAWLLWMALILVNVFVAILMHSYESTQEQMEQMEQMDRTKMELNVIGAIKQYSRRWISADSDHAEEEEEEDENEDHEHNEHRQLLKAEMDEMKALMEMMLRTDPSGKKALKIRDNQSK